MLLMEGSNGLPSWPADTYGAVRFFDHEIEQVVILDDEEWERTVQPGRSALYCRRRLSVGRSGNQTIKFALSCDTWTCRRCAQQKAMRHLGRVHEVLSSGYSEVAILTLSTEAERASFRQAVGVP